jgi:anti-anti-sigma regulatory factor
MVVIVILEQQFLISCSRLLDKATCDLQTITHILIFILSAVSAIDTSGVSLFKDLRKAMEKKGVEAST